MWDKRPWAGRHACSHIECTFMHENFMFASCCQNLSDILNVYQVLDATKSLRGSSQFMTLTKVRAICELRLPFTTSYARNMAAKCRELCQMTFFFFPPARSRLIPVYSRKWGASDICLKLKPNKPLSSFFLCERSKTQQTSGTAETRFELNYKRQMTLISHKVWQLLSTCKEIVGGHT